MKKIISLILALVLVLGLAVSASATTVHTFTNDPDTTNEPPYTDTGIGSFNITPATINPVYYVDVEWESLVFEYSFGTEPQWDPENHIYSPGSAAGWIDDKTSAKVTVTNHSNKPLNVAATMDNTDKNGINVTYTWDKTTLETADAPARLNDKNLADECVLTVNVAGIPTSAADFDIGTITVTVSTPTP